MLTVEDNELLCRVGPGTGMGAALRRYWIPACLSSDLPGPDSDPLRLRLLGESYVAFRDSDGRLGLLDEHCPHRGASLAFGRNEDCGLRCLWHGWKFGVDGTLQQTPNVPDSRFKERVRASSYPLCEAGGVVWAYLGSPEHQPELPVYQWMTVPDEHRLIVPIDLDCNFVQPLEGLVDSSHVGILHTDTVRRLADEARSDGEALSRDSAPRLVVERTDFGFHYAALRSCAGTGEGLSQVRVSAYVAPFLVFIAPAGQAFMAVPVDDTHTRFLNIFWDRDRRLVDGPGREERLTVFGLHEDVLSATGMLATRTGATDGPPGRNRFTQDRAAMKANATYSGLPGLTAEDAAMTCSMGPLYDRTKELLVPADLGVIRLRRVLLGAARDVADGESPVGVDTSTNPHDITAASGVVRDDEAWQSLVPGHVVSGDQS